MIQRAYDEDDQFLSLSSVLTFRCRDREVLQEDEEQEEEVTGSLLRGGEGEGDIVSSQEDEACPPLLPVSPVPQQLQSSLHCINLSVQQVCPQSRSKHSNC